MKNIQAQYKDLLEGKMPKHNFMRNVRMEFPQYVSPTNSYDDAIRILKSKRILSEVEAKGVFGYDPNAENPPKPGIDQLNYYQVYHGIQYELAQMPEITDENYIKARKKVVDAILKDPDAYKELQLANFKAVKAMDEDLKMKAVKEDNKVDKPNALKVIKKDAKANTEDTLGKKEAKKAKNGKGIEVMTQTPKKAKGIAKVMEVPGKEKTLRESTMLREENLQQYAKKIADQHNLILIPQPLEKPQLYQMWKKEKGSFGTKAGVMTFIPNTKTVNVLSSDEKIPEAVFAQFKADKGGDDQGFETKTFAEDGAKGYFKNFSITDVNEAKIKALKESIVGEMTKLNPTHEMLGVGSRVKKKDGSLVGEITEWDGHTAAVKDDKDGRVSHIQGNVLTKKDVPAKEEKEAYKNNTADNHQWANGKVKKEVEESREDKMDKLREKLTKVVRQEIAQVKDDKGAVVKLSANSADAQKFVQAQDPAVKSKLKVTGS
jgi:hypothetical protein